MLFHQHIRRFFQKVLGLESMLNSFESLQKNFHSINNDLDYIAQRTSRFEAAEYTSRHMQNACIFRSAAEVLQFAKSQVKAEISEGLYLEFGVWTGNSIRLIATDLPYTVYGFDSFEGLPESWRQGFDKGTFRLKNDKLPPVPDNVTLIKGWFSETLPIFVAKTTKTIALLHVDCDLYSSTKTIFDLLGDRLVKGSIIVFNEYFGYPTWRDHEYKAFQEFTTSNAISYEYLAYNASHEQVAVRIL